MCVFILESTIEMKKALLLAQTVKSLAYFTSHENTEIETFTLDHTIPLILTHSSETDQLLIV
jgi:hypothetical protein